MTNLTLLASFDIDHGEVDDLTPRLAFVLGAEFTCFMNFLDHAKEDELDFPIHRANLERLSKLADKKGWSVEPEFTDKSQAVLLLTRRPKLSLVKPC